MKLEHLLKNTYCIDMGYPVIGCYFLSANEAVLIDSGLQRSPQLLELFERKHIRISAVLCTHLHPDHISNNYDLAKKFGSVIYASEEELQETMEEGRPLWPGIENADENIHLTTFDSYKGKLQIGGQEFICVRTPGHTGGHVSYITPDNVCFIGDAMVSPKLLRLMKLPYFKDISSALKSMEKMKKLSCNMYVAAHKGPEDPSRWEAFVDANIEKELQIFQVILDLAAGSVSAQELTQRVMDAVRIDNPKYRTGYYKASVENRIYALVRQGRLLYKDGTVCPAAR